MSSLFLVSPENCLSTSLLVLDALAGLTDPRESRTSFLTFTPVLGLSVEEFIFPLCEFCRFIKSLVPEDEGLTFSDDFNLLLLSALAITSTGVSSCFLGFTSSLFLLIEGETADDPQPILFTVLTFSLDADLFQYKVLMESITVVA